jgi:dolichol-phosphate mannosyltransferase
VARCEESGLDLATAAGVFECPSAPLRWLHPALLTTLLVRASPSGGPVHRLIGNGQCMAFRRTTLVSAGGFGPVAHHTVEDLALVRSMATAGFAVGFLDGSSLLSVRMFESAPEAWWGWGRSLSMPGVDPWWRRTGDVATLVVVQVLPLLRLVTGRADRLDAVLLATRLGTLIGTRHAYRRRGVAYWLSPLADGPAVATLVSGLLRRRPRWRGRTY